MPEIVIITKTLNHMAGGIGHLWTGPSGTKPPVLIKKVKKVDKDQFAAGICYINFVKLSLKLIL